MLTNARRFGYICLVLITSSLAVNSSAAETLSPEQWREDLSILDQTVRTVHKSPFHTVSEENFAASVDALHAAIPNLSDQEIIVQLAAIVASVL